MKVAATAKTTPAEVKVIREEEVTLTMSHDVAQVLRNLIGLHVTGVGEVRRATSAIYDALTVAGFNSEPGDFSGFARAER